LGGGGAWDLDGYGCLDLAISSLKTVARFGHQLIKSSSFIHPIDRFDHII